MAGELHEDAAPGASGIFGTIASAPDLTERIGLEQDTNASHTRRLLLLQESASIYDDDLRLKLLRSVLARYKLARQDHERPPRFLVNDFIRYWYTLTVDYQAKRWEGRERGWGLRYLKLIGSRKLTFASTMASLLSFGPAKPATLEALVAEFEKPALARLASLALHPTFEQEDALREVLLFAEQFAGFLADKGNRDAAKGAQSLEDFKAGSAMAEVRQASREMDVNLKKVFLDSYLGEQTRRYMLF